VRADVEEVAIPALLRRAEVRSVVVAGAGCGREYEYLQRHGFDLWGFDISPTMAAEARARFPSIPTEVASVVGAHRTQPRADAVVSSAVLTHVPPEDIAAAVDSLKQLARRIVILREKTIFMAQSGYQWQHDYDVLFAPWRSTHRKTTDERRNERVELMAWERPKQSRDVLRNDADRGLQRDL
jgi:trans-aconitate methyltransferase